MAINRMNLKGSIIAGLTGVGLCVTEAVFSPAHATQQFFCPGRMSNGWNYTAEFVNGRFTQIRWERSGQPPQVTTLTFSSTNTAGQPIYRGSFQAATAITLVDLSKGNVGVGSEISVGAEEWGWSRGTCGTSSSSGGSGSSSSTSTVRQNLLGVEQNQARDWLQQNNFFFVQTMEHTDARVIERWKLVDMSQGVDVIIVNGNVSDVVEAR